MYNVQCLTNTWSIKLQQNTRKFQTYSEFPLSGERHIKILNIQVNLDMTDTMGPGKVVRHMQNPSYTYDKYLICIGLGPSILSVICKNLSYSGPSYPSSPVVIFSLKCFKIFSYISNKIHVTRTAEIGSEIHVNLLSTTSKYACFENI